MTDSSSEILRAGGLVGLSSGELGSLVGAADRSAEGIDRARTLLQGRSSLSSSGADFVAFGSLARHEMTVNSDFDYLIVKGEGDGPEEPDPLFLEAVELLRENIIEGVTLSPPGKSGLFGTTVFRESVTKTIGLEADTNTILTRRVLLLEESVSLLRPDLHSSLITEVLEQYLRLRKVESKSIPRVLLNDLIRYWRTIAVDYHAKSMAATPYSLRYLKLLIPRKLCFVASIAPLFLMSNRLDDIDDELAFLCEAYSQPSVVRLARLLSALAGGRDGDTDAVRQSTREVLCTFNYFVERSGDAEWRSAVNTECAKPEPWEGENFGEMRQRGRSLHQQIGRLFTSEAMLPFTREYMLT